MILRRKFVDIIRLKNINKFYTLLFVCAFAFQMLAIAVCSAEIVDDSFADMSIEALMDIEITSVSKKLQTVSEAPAAIFVITSEDIKRSGVTSIAEVLRMAPGVHVAKFDANKWAISIRGFNGRFANKLLVLIDGRTVYTPLFSGVLWEGQDLIMSDIDRIEVIRGPGAALWGSNAVNGVINIITKKASESRGGYLDVKAGTSENDVSMRYEKQLNERTAYRAYAKFKDIDNQVYMDTDIDAEDDGQVFKTGVRIDHTIDAANELQFHGAYIEEKLGETVVSTEISFSGPPYAEVTYPFFESKYKNGYGLLKWHRNQSDVSDFTVQLYHDRVEYETIFANLDLDTTDISFQHQYNWAENQEIVWGAGYRYISDKVDIFSLVDLDPDEEDCSLLNFFIQNETAFFDEGLRLVIGSQFERNDYSGWEIQPSARLLWQMTERHSIWASVSRAVRTLSRIERDGTVVGALPNFDAPMQGYVNMGSGVDPEKFMAYELGYRSKIRNNVSVDATLFLHDFDALRGSIMETPYFHPDLGHLILPVEYALLIEAKVYGFETFIDWHPSTKTRFKLSYTYLNMDLAYKDPNSTGPVDYVGDPEFEENKNPKNQISLRAWHDIHENLQFDAWGRYVSSLAFNQC